MVLFVVEDEAYEYVTVAEYVDSQKVDEDEIQMQDTVYSYKYENYKDVEKELVYAGFTNISFEILYDIILGWTKEGEVDSVSINGNDDFEKGDIFKKDASVVITYHMKAEDDPNKVVESEKSDTNTIKPDETAKEETESPVFYSTNTYEVARQGNTGVFAYRSKGASYDIYWIVDFDEGYVYYFAEGDGNTFCDKLKIEEGDLNTFVTITYHDGDMQWSQKLHFKYKNAPETLIMIDHNGFDWEYSTTNLEEALSIRDTKRISEY